MIETLNEKETTASPPQPGAPELVGAAAPEVRGRRSSVRIGYAIRSALATAVVLSWALVAFRPILSTSPAQSSTDAETAIRTEVFLSMLPTARQYCPAGQPVLMLNNESSADNLADYYLYPRRVDVLRLTDPFGAADLDAHAGGCLLYYSPQAGQRLKPFQSRLKEIICTGEGCLYNIKP